MLHTNYFSVSPTKALCNEIYSSWSQKFKPYKIETIALTGDSVAYDLGGLDAYNIIITTPEKWDSLTRKWNENKALVQTIKLVLIDEIHILNDAKRGAVIEAIVSRFKTFQNKAMQGYSLTTTSQGADAFYKRQIRFVLLSATFVNVDDIAEWIGHPVKTFRQVSIVYE